MSAPITEAHIDLVRYVLDAEWYGTNVEKKFAQEIADSEARAVAEWQNSAHIKGEAIDSLLIECDQLRAEVKQLLKQIKQATKDHARAELAELEVERLKSDGAASAFIDMACRASHAEAELANIRALANRRNKQNHSHDTTHQLVASLDQSLDIVQAELAAEQARLDWLESDAGMDFQWSTVRVITRAAIDAAMKEGAK